MGLGEIPVNRKKSKHEGTEKHRGETVQLPSTDSEITLQVECREKKNILQY